MILVFFLACSGFALDISSVLPYLNFNATISDYIENETMIPMVINIIKSLASDYINIIPNLFSNETRNMLSLISNLLTYPQINLAEMIGFPIQGLLYDAVSSITTEIFTGYFGNYVNDLLNYVNNNFESFNFANFVEFAFGCPVPLENLVNLFNLLTKPNYTLKQFNEYLNISTYFEQIAYKMSTFSAESHINIHTLLSILTSGYIPQLITKFASPYVEAIEHRINLFQAELEFYHLTIENISDIIYSEFLSIQSMLTFYKDIISTLTTRLPTNIQSIFQILLPILTDSFNFTEYFTTTYNIPKQILYVVLGQIVNIDTTIDSIVQIVSMIKGNLTIYTNFQALVNGFTNLINGLNNKDTVVYQLIRDFLNETNIMNAQSFDKIFNMLPFMTLSLIDMFFNYLKTIVNYYNNDLPFREFLDYLKISDTEYKEINIEAIDSLLTGTFQSIISNYIDLDKLNNILDQIFYLANYYISVINENIGEETNHKMKDFLNLIIEIIPKLKTDSYKIVNLFDDIYPDSSRILSIYKEIGLKINDGSSLKQIAEVVDKNFWDLSTSLQNLVTSFDDTNAQITLTNLYKLFEVSEESHYEFSVYKIQQTLTLIGNIISQLISNQMITINEFPLFNSITPQLTSFSTQFVTTMSSSPNDFIKTITAGAINLETLYEKLVILYNKIITNNEIGINDIIKLINEEIILPEYRHYFNIQIGLLQGKLTLNDIIRMNTTNFTAEQFENLVHSFASEEENLIPEFIPEEDKQNALYALGNMTGEINLVEILGLQSMTSFIGSISTLVTAMINDDITMIFNLNTTNVQSFVSYFLSSLSNFNIGRAFSSIGIQVNFSNIECLIKLLTNETYPIIKFNNDIGDLETYYQPIIQLAKEFTADTPINKDLILPIILSGYLTEVINEFIDPYVIPIQQIFQIISNVFNFDEVPVYLRIQKIQNNVVELLRFLVTMLPPELTDTINYVIDFLADDLNVLTLLESYNITRNITQPIFYILCSCFETTIDGIIEIASNYGLVNMTIYQQIKQGILLGILILPSSSLTDLTNLILTEFNVTINSKDILDNIFSFILENNQIISIIDSLTGFITQLKQIYETNVPFSEIFYINISQFLPIDIDLSQINIEQYLPILQQMIKSFPFQEILRFIGIDTSFNSLLKLLYNLGYMISPIIPQDKINQFYHNINLLNNETTTISNVLDWITNDGSRLLDILIQIIADYLTNKSFKDIITNIDKRFWNATNTIETIIYHNPTIPQLISSFNTADNPYEFNINKIINPFNSIINYLTEFYSQSSTNYIIQNLPNSENIVQFIYNLPKVFSMTIDDGINYITNNKLKGNIEAIRITSYKIRNNEGVGITELANILRGVILYRPTDKIQTIKSVYEIPKLELATPDTTTLLTIYNSNNDNKVPIVVNDLIIRPSTTINTINLQIINTLSIESNSLISPYDVTNDYININNNMINITTTYSSTINLGNSNVNNIPKIFKVIINVNNFNDDQIVNEFNGGKLLVNSNNNQINVNQWINNSVLDIIKQNNSKSEFNIVTKDNKIYITSSLTPEIIDEIVDESEGLSDGAIAGIVIAVVVVVIVIIVGIVCGVKRSGKNKVDSMSSISSLSEEEINGEDEDEM